jgi:uncharacterized protein YjgD (DUF1641 family)
MSEHVIRPLIRKDRKRVTAMIKKVITETRDEAIQNLISSESPQVENETEAEHWGVTITDIGVDILVKGIEFLDDDIGEWFADLLGVSMEEFDKMPADIEIQVFKQIKERPEASAFFTRAWQSAKLTRVLETGLQMLKDQFTSGSESETQSTIDTTTEQLQDLPKTSQS